MLSNPSTSDTTLIDVHTHLDQYDPKELPGILDRAHSAGVSLIIAAGTTLESCRAILGICDEFKMIYAGVGLHPSDLSGIVDDVTEDVLRKLAGNPKVITWSETGLDYMPASPDRHIQHQAFRAQIRIATELKLPLVIHSREADPDTLQILREENAHSVGGAWHYFQGDLPTARAAMELGFYISLAKPLLRLPELQHVASQLPLESIVLETDSFPQPFKKYRERWTEPFHLPMVAQELARLHNISVEEVASSTTANAHKMLHYRLSGSISG